MAFEETKTVTVYKGEEVVVIDAADLEAYKAKGYSDEAPKAEAPKTPEKPATPPAK